MSAANTPSPQGKHLIAGEYSAERLGNVTSINPATKEAGALHYPEATPDEIHRAVSAAQAAFAHTRLYPAAKLAAFLESCADEVEALGDALLATADLETGLGLPRLTGERGRTTGQLRKFAALLREGAYVDAVIDPADPTRQPAPKPDIRRMNLPIGPVAVFSASNFPFAFSVAGGDTASALAAGCPVIVKAHPGHPATSELTASAINAAIRKAGFPAGFFSLLHGADVEVGQGLVKHPGVMAVGFTGSLRAGRALYDAAAQRPTPIPVYAEMGSVNPMIVTSSALGERLESLADGLTGSLTLGSGQFCTNPGLVFVPSGEQGQVFIQAVAQRMSAQPPGVLLNANIEAGLAQAVAATLNSGLVEKHTGGAVAQGPAYCYQNTVLQTSAALFIENDTLQTEHFGPVVLFVTYEGHQQLMACIQALHGNLTATLHATDSEGEEAAAIYNHLREKAGRLIWNGYPTGVEVVHAMQHGGPYPATTAPATTSVGTGAIQRFLRPVAFQNLPDALLPPALQNANPLGIWRRVNDTLTKAPIDPA